MKLIFYFGSNFGRSKIVLAAWRQCFARLGLVLPMKMETEYRGIEADICLMYGLWGNNRRALEDYPAAGRKAILCDLGYWGRLEDGKSFGYHRLALDGRHATPYFQRTRHPRDRFEHFGLELRPFRRDGSHILLCGMSGKAAGVYGYRPEQWEREAVATLRQHTKREIRYRPKPSWKDAQPIDGATWAPAGRERMIDERSFADCWAVVTHHGNTSLDALIAGVPAFCEHGLAEPLSCQNLASIESPLYPDEAERDQLLWDAAYSQFKISEISDGTAWAHLRNEGLI